ARLAPRKVSGEPDHAPVRLHAGWAEDRPPGDRLVSSEATLRVDPAELAGRRALVTGGTAGVGAAIVSRLAAAGARVATAARSSRPASDVSDLYVQADLSTPGGVETVARAVLERYGSVDIVVHNV